MTWGFKAYELKSTSYKKIKYQSIKNNWLILLKKRVASGYLTLEEITDGPVYDFDVFEILDKIKQTIPTGRLAHVDEVAAAVCYLVSDLAAYTTAANIEVNGGMYSS